MNPREEIIGALDTLRRRQLTLPEVAMVADLDPKEVRRAADKGHLRVVTFRRGKRSYRGASGDSVVGYLIAHSGPFKAGAWEAINRAVLDPAAWVVSGREVLAPITGLGEGATPLFVGVAEATKRALGGIERIDRALEGIEVPRSGEPLIKGTDVEAYRIAALVEGGMEVAEVVRDYPGLTREGVENAVRYAKSRPKQGRPYPGRTAKAALRASRGGLGRALAAGVGE